VVVCIRSCEFADEKGCTCCYLPGVAITVGAVKEREVQSRSFGGWLPAECVIAEADAQAHFERRLQANPNDAEARSGLAIRLLQSDKNEALRQAKEAVRREENWITLFSQGNGHWSRDEKDEAEASLARAIEIAPDQAELQILRGELCLQQDPARALAAFNRALELDRRDIEALRYRALVRSTHLKDPEKALEDLDTALSLRPTAVACLKGRTAILLQLKKSLRALDDCEAILKIDPQCAEAYRYRGMALLTMGKAPDAIEAFSKALELDPGTPSEHANTLMARSGCFMAQQEYEKALADCSEAARLQPQNANYRGNLGAIRLYKDDWQQAIADLTEAIRLDPKSSAWVANRGAAYLETCEYEKAIDDLNQSLLLDAKEIRARCRLAMIYAACPDDSFRDVKKAKDVLVVLMGDEDFKRDKDPENAMLMVRAMAAVCAEAGEFKSAVDLERKEVGFTVMKNDEEGERAARERMALYQAGKPYRLPTKKR
jgi:tetratricopeptide (TPR) repeat protein